MGVIRGILSLLFVAGNTVFWATATFVLKAVGLLLPVRRWRRVWPGVMNRIIDGWVSCNGAVLHRLLPTRVEVRGGKALRRDGWPNASAGSPWARAQRTNLVPSTRSSL